VAPFGVRVVSIRPGFIATEFNTVANQMSAGLTSPVLEDYERISQTAREALGRMWADVEPFAPEVVAQLILEVVRSEHPRAAYAIGPLTEELLAERARLNDDEWRDAMDKRTGLDGLIL
jgi:NAD(P)-dependent dehydrogenase (short-subunit alcohol dehydrogenase family)